VKNPLHLLTMLLCFLVLAAGCTSSRQAAVTADTNGPATKGATTVQAWVIANNTRAEQDFLDTVKPYLALHPSLSVEVKVLDWSTAWNTITNAVANQEGPDILQLGSTWVPAIAAMNGLEDLSDKTAEVGGPGAYLPSIWNSTMIQGRPQVYAIPWFVEARAIFYRKDAFAAAGVDPNTAFQTWDTFEKALKQVNGVVIDGQKMSAFGIPGKNDWNVAHNMFPWVWGAGGDILTPDYKAAAFNDDKALEGIMYFTGLANSGLVNPTSFEKNSNQIDIDFADGKNAAIISGIWLLRNFATSSDQGGFSDRLAATNYGVASLPAGPAKKATFIGGSDLAVFNYAKNKEAAWDMISYLSSDEAQLAYAKCAGMLPAKKSQLESPELMGLPGYAAFAEASKYGISNPALPQWGPIETAMVGYFGDIWDIVAGGPGIYSEETVRKRLDQAAEEINIMLKQ
jgi:multiple sugar transport system substrate-binding protein